MPTNATYTRLFRFGAMVKGDYLDQAYRLTDWEDALNSANGLDELLKVVQLIYFIPIIQDSASFHLEEEASYYRPEEHKVFIKKRVSPTEDAKVVFKAALEELSQIHPVLSPILAFLERYMN